MKVKVRKTKKDLYPAASILEQACYEDYKNELDSYNKIYEKVDVSFAICSVVLLVIADKINLSYVSKMVDAENVWALLLALVMLVLPIIATFFIGAAVIGLLSLMKSSEIKIFNSIDIRNGKIYTYLPDRASVWLIGAYTDCVVSLRKATNKKQKKFDQCVGKIIVALLLYAVSLILEKAV